MIKTILQLAFLLVSILGFAYLFGQNVGFGFGVLFAFCLGLIILLHLQAGLILILGALLLGQLVRIPFPGGASQFLPNDLLIPCFLLFWLGRKLYLRHFRLVSTPLDLPLFLFLAIAFISLIWGSRNLLLRETVTASLYLIRFAEYALLFYAVLDLAQNQAWVKRNLKFLLVVALLLAGLGFLQYILIPDFSTLAAQGGWDPHIKRLFSTWLDPNFMGGFFVLILSFVIAFYLYSQNKKAKLVLLACAAVFLLALLLTYSRSAFLAFCVVLVFIGVFKSRRVLFFGLIILVLLTVFSERLQARLTGATSLDVTAQYRLSSWRNTLAIIRAHPFLGVGYNAFRYAQLSAGTLGPEASHSDFGSDSSFLTIMATTGILGFGAYLWLLGACFGLSWRSLRQGRSDIERALGLGFCAGLGGLLVHAQFTNSLLYPFFLEIIWFGLACLFFLQKKEQLIQKL